MNALGGIALRIGAVLAVWATTYIIVFSLAARKGGYRLWSRRRFHAFRTRRAECVGGPMDGERFPVRRGDLLGLTLAAWPDVLYDAYTGTHRLGSRETRSVDDPSSCWAGWYAMHFMADRYEWHGTGLERYYDIRVRGGVA